MSPRRPVELTTVVPKWAPTSSACCCWPNPAAKPLKIKPHTRTQRIDLTKCSMRHIRGKLAIRISGERILTMSNAVSVVKEIYSAFGRGDVTAILSRLADDVHWEAEGPTSISFAGTRRGRNE